jgi:hypothetical protein
MGIFSYNTHVATILTNQRRLLFTFFNSSEITSELPCRLLNLSEAYPAKLPAGILTASETNKRTDSDINNATFPIA